MKTNLLTVPAALQVWEDLVLDFLEMACCLETRHSRLLMRALRREKISAQSISVYPCFAVAGRFVIVLDRHREEETEAGNGTQCWLYDPLGRTLRKAVL